MDVKELIPNYISHLKACNFSSYTITNSKNALNYFIRFLLAEGISDIDQLTLEIIEEYQQELAFTFTKTGKPLRVRTQSARLTIVKGFCRYLKEHDYIIHDPAVYIRLPKKEKPLPRAILNEPEMKKLIAAPDTHTNRGYRNRIIVELLYDTGIRRGEIADIKLPDIDLKGGYLLVRGKGNKERVVPVSDKVCALLRNYILAVRPSFLKGGDHSHLFINHRGDGLGMDGIYRIVKQCANLANLKTRVSTHTLRHTCATHMLRNGAPIRHLQEMLGHESVETTQIYAHVTINDLKEIHAKYHPLNRENKAV